MSFQGDVRGIGLAELLQGLARGQKEGILTLTAKGTRRSVLGIEDGKAWLLPDPDEDPEGWAARAADAWANDPEFTVTAERLEPIAKAGRLETLYALLDGGGVHFRFDPGSVGDRTTTLASEGAPASRVHCPPTPIEFLLLEYARIADELELAGTPAFPDPSNRPCLVSVEALGETPPALRESCDGASSIQEIADRLAQPLRQVQLGLLKGVRGGGLRLAAPLEQLHDAVEEMRRERYSRAANRLTVWCQDGAPGPLDEADADTLTQEWVAGRLISCARLMEMRDVRTLLRRLDATLGCTSHAVAHWTEAQRMAPGDRIVRLRLAAARLREEGEDCTMEPREALDLARDLRDHGAAILSGPALAIAAHLQPTAVSERLELGLGLLGASRVADAGPWILSACADMLAQGHADRLLAPLRSLLEQDPRNREARELLTRARRRSTRSRKFRRHATIAGAVALTFATMGLSKLRSDEARRAEIESIERMTGSPTAALARLDATFASDLSVEILELRMRLEDRLRKEEEVLVQEWDETFDRARDEALEGELLVALELYRSLPEPPELRLLSRPWRSGTEVLSGMTARLEAEVVALGPPSIHAPRQVTVESDVRDQVERLERALSEEERTSPILAAFRADLDAIEELLLTRGRSRSVARLEAEHERTLRENDELLALAHAAVDRGDHAEALEFYGRILENDPAGKVRRVLEQEVARTRRRLETLERARAAATAGDHARALELLQETFEDTDGIALPFSVTTTPPGVRVTAQRNGEDLGEGAPLTTPLVLEGTFADTWTLRFDQDGFDSRALVVRGPQDVDLELSRTPALHFQVDGRVDAIPAPVGDGTSGEYVLCDRGGAIARVGWGGEVRWTRDVEDVSGVARRPVRMPGLQGVQLLLTESGNAWLLDPEDGVLRGPRSLPAPPVFGPVVVATEARAVLRDGSVAAWTSSLLPEVTAGAGASGLDESLRYGFEGLFTVLRPEAGGGILETRAGEGQRWTVEVGEGWYTVRAGGASATPFHVRREGACAYVAWEAPSVEGDPPVLWVSDGLGLRAFVPPGTERTVAAR